MTARISLTPEARDRLKDIADGMGLTYDALFRFLMDRLVPPGTEDMIYGYQMREEAQKYAEKHGLLEKRGKSE